MTTQPSDWAVRTAFLELTEAPAYEVLNTHFRENVMKRARELDASGDAPRAAEAGDGWLRACDEEMVGAFIGVADASDDYPTAKKKLHALICWHTKVATDPAVNGGFVLVPLEPTPEMWKAGKAASCEAEQVYAQDRPQSVWERFGYRKNRVAHVYKAMLRAAMGAVGAGD